MALLIDAPKAYDLLSSVHAWVYPDTQPVPEVTWNNGFGRVFTIGDTQLPLMVSQKSPGDKLQVNYNTENASKPDVRRKIRQVLGLDVDTSNAVKHIADDPAVRAVESSVKGLRPYCTDSVFEALIKSILQQQVSYRAASVLTKRMITGLSTPSVFADRLLYSFPGPTTIAKAGKKRLSGFGFGFKASYVHDVCRAVTSGTLAVEQLSGKTAADARKMLKSFRGIGDWTIDALAISGLGDFSVFPSGDLGMRNLLGRLYNKGTRISQAQVDERLDSWGPEGPMILYLLMCADVLGMLGPAGRPKTHKREPSEAQRET
jgi:DNA-3-methyladenine glycosylase II